MPLLKLLKPLPEISADVRCRLTSCSDSYRSKVAFAAADASAVAANLATCAPGPHEAAISSEVISAEMHASAQLRSRWPNTSGRMGARRERHKGRPAVMASSFRGADCRAHRAGRR